MKTPRALAPLLLLLTIGLSRWWMAPPAPLPASAPTGVFSAGRALPILHRLLDGIGPHPVGTPAATEVRERLLAELRSLGLSPELETHTVCGHSCATVVNVLVPVPGTDPSRPWILASAHYDSTASGPGAADDGSGVAAMVEVARIVRDGPLPSGVLFFFNEGEEADLLGAMALERSPWHEKIGAAVNLEARGTGGNAYLFEIAGPSDPMGKITGRVRSPSVSSLYVEIYRMLPNGTDVMVYDALGYPSANVAFLGNGDQYHTPLDDLPHLDPRSLQHHGEQALGLIQGLAAADFSTFDDAEDAVLFDLLGLVVIRVPHSFALLLALGLCVFAGGLVARQRSLMPVLGALLCAVWVGGVGGLGLGLDQLSMALGAAWYGLPWVPELGLWFVVVAGWLGLGRWVAQRETLPAVLLFFVGLTGLAAWLLPGGLYLPALTVLSLSVGLVLPRLRPGAAVVGALPWMHLGLGLPTALGLFGPVVTGPLAVALLPLSPLLRPLPARLLGVVGGFGMLLLASTGVLPSTTEEHPDALELDLLQRGGDAWLFASPARFPRPGPPPSGFVPIDPETPRPWLGPFVRTWELSEHPPAVFTPTPKGGRLDAPGAHGVVIGGDVRGLQINGERVQRVPALFHGAVDGLSLRWESGSTLWTRAIYAGVPGPLELPPHRVPIHTGFRTQVFAEHGL